MAVNQTPASLESQMNSSFKEEDKKPVPTPVGIQPQTQAPLNVPPGLDQKPKAQTTAQSILQQEGLTTPAVTQPGTTAKSILQKEGVSSPRQLLQSMKVPSAKDIIEGAGLTSAEDILEKEATKQKNQAALVKEMEYREKEKEFMRDYKFDADALNPTEYETKYGTLNFKQSKVSTDWGWNDTDTTWSYKYEIDGKKYHFIPESVITKGAIGKDNAQYFNTAFLNKDTYKAMAEYGQAMDLSNMDVSKFAQGNSGSRTFAEQQMQQMQSTGFLFSEEDFKEFREKYLAGNWKSWGSLNDSYGTASNKFGGNIQGISQLADGSLVYATQPVTGYDQASTYIGADGVAWRHTYNKGRGGLLGGIVGFVGDVFNAVPFLPEIIAIAVPGAAPFYPAMKGSQVVAGGGDLGDTIAAMGTAVLATSPVMKNLTTSASATFVDMGLSQTAANIAAGAVVNAGFAGTVAALTGRDVDKAIVTGALSGGFSAGTPEIAEAMFGKTNIEPLAKSLNMSKSQFQNLVVASLGNATINAAVNNRDFFEVLTQDLVTKGLSVSAANKVGQNMKANNADAAQIQKAVVGTRLVVEATARSAIRGTDINLELERSLNSLAGSKIMSSVRSASE